MFNLFWNIIAKILSQPKIVDWLVRRAIKTPYTHIKSMDGLSTYMERYWLFNPYPIGSMGQRPNWQFPISIRLHHILLPDEDRHLHDHPWNARTIILRGGYSEITNKEGKFYIHIKGESHKIRFNKDYHQITAVTDGGVWTLFITGRYQGDWGFMVNGGKMPHSEYFWRFQDETNALFKL